MPYTKDKNETKVIEEEVMKDKRTAVKNNKRRYITMGIAALVAVLLIILLLTGAYEKFLGLFGIQSDVSVAPKITEVSASFSGDVHLTGNNETIMVYDEQGVTGYDTSGQWVWNESCSVSNPAIYNCDEYVAIADIGGTAIYSFNENGAFWKHGTSEPIVSIFCKDNYVGIIHEKNEYLSALTMYKYNDKTNSLDEVFERKFASHYMIAGAISSDCKQIAISGIYSEGSKVYGIVSFIKMSDGEIFSNEVVEENVYIKLEYIDEDTVFASGSDSACVINKTLSVSSENDSFKEFWDRNNSVEYIVDSTVTSDELFVSAIVSDNLEKSLIKGYNKEGKESLNIEINGNIIGIDSMGENFMVYTKSHVNLYNSKGQLIASQEAGYEILGAVCYAERYVVIYTKEKMLSVSFN